MFWGWVLNWSWILFCLVLLFQPLCFHALHHRWIFNVHRQINENVTERATSCFLLQQSVKCRVSVGALCEGDDGYLPTSCPVWFLVFFFFFLLFFQTPLQFPLSFESQLVCYETSWSCVLNMKMSSAVSSSLDESSPICVGELSRSFII